MKKPTTKLLSLLLFAGMPVLAAGNSQTQAGGGDAISPFGIGSCAQRSGDLPDWLPQMSAIGLKILRTCRAGWLGVEPTPGKFDFTKLDEQLNFVSSLGMQAGGMLQGVASKEHKGMLPVYDLPAWSAYVSGVVGHTRGKVKYWAVWNEPPNGTHNAPASDYAKTVMAAYDAAKAANPDCMLGISVKSVDLNYIYQVIKAGAKDHFDYISLHPYETLGCATNHPGTEPVFMGIVPTLRKMLADIDPAKANCPIWFTEIGCDTRKGEAHQAHVLVKAYTMSIAQGLACVNWFEGMDGDSGPMGLLRADRSQRPDYVALGQMIREMGSYPVYLGWVLLNDRDYGFVFQGAKGPVLITWATVNATDTVDFGQPVRIVDPLTGNSTQAASYALTEAPIIVAGVPEKLVAQAQANKSKPFPWGGDYTNAKSISITMGAKTVEKGLHTQAGDTFAADVIAYGGSARSGSVPGGNVYMVDPNFLSYTSTPIELSAVVRTNDPTQLNLEYESTSGFKKLPPYPVPADNASHTVTWKIDDAQFVSMYGFSFRLNAGKYFIQSVTVSKLN